MKQPFIVPLLSIASFVASGCSSQNPTRPSAIAGQSAQTGSSSAAVVAPASVPHNSEQVVFSGVAGINDTLGTPVGFWIWCEADSTNPYQGECNGAMYFYELGITRHVEDSSKIQELADGQYMITVNASRDSSIACTLTNTPPPQHGPTNTVVVVCTAPHSGQATSTNAVVNVTGPQ